MKEIKIYRAIDALPLMGILCAKASVDLYIGNMFKDGMLPTSYKLNNRWCISQTDIDYIRERIMSGEYKPSAKFKSKKAAEFDFFK